MVSEEGRTITFTQSEQQRIDWRKWRVSGTSGILTKDPTFIYWSPRRTEERIWGWRVFEEIKAENFVNLVKFESYRFEKWSEPQVKKINLKRLHTVWFHFITWLKWQNDRNGGQMSGCQELREVVGVEWMCLCKGNTRGPHIEMFCVWSGSRSAFWLWCCRMVWQDVTIEGNCFHVTGTQELSPSKLLYGNLQWPQNKKD